MATFASAVVNAVPAFLPITILSLPPEVILSPASSPIRILSVHADAVSISAPASKVISDEKLEGVPPISENSVPL